MCVFRHFTENVTKGLAVFKIMCLNNVNEKLILKKIGENFELLEILVLLLFNKFSFLK